MTIRIHLEELESSATLLPVPKLANLLRFFLGTFKLSLKEIPNTVVEVAIIKAVCMAVRVKILFCGKAVADLKWKE